MSTSPTPPAHPKLFPTDGDARRERIYAKKQAAIANGRLFALIGPDALRSLDRIVAKCPGIADRAGLLRVLLIQLDRQARGHKEIHLDEINFVPKKS